MITTKPITSVAYLIALRGEVSAEDVDFLADRLAGLLARGAQEIVVDLSGTVELRGTVDLSGITRVASSALLDVLLQAAELLEESGGELLLASREETGSAYLLVRLRPRTPEDVRGLHPALDAALANAQA